MDWTQEKLEELYQKVNERGKKDPEFMKKVLSDPKAAMEETAGCRLPDHLNMKFIEKGLTDDASLTAPDFAEGEMDMAEMRSVAGGAGNGSLCDIYTVQFAEKNNLNFVLMIGTGGADTFCRWNFNIPCGPDLIDGNPFSGGRCDADAGKDMASPDCVDIE